MPAALTELTDELIEKAIAQGVAEVFGTMAREKIELLGRTPNPPLHSKPLGISGAHVVASVGFLVWWAVVAPMAFVLWWLVPTLLSSTFMGVSYLADHYGCAFAPDLVTRTGRSVRSNAVMQFLTWNINFHAVHHLAPGVPTQHRPAAHAMFEPYLENYERSYWSFHKHVLADIRHHRYVPDPPWIIDLRD